MRYNFKQDFLNAPEYAFLQEIPNIILLGYGGSTAYGTNLPTSDTDVRGILMNSMPELYGTRPETEQREDRATDTVIYGFRKIFNLLRACNPNTIELLGLKPEHYLYTTEAGKYLIDHAHDFLSQMAIKTFGGYAYQQLNRLVNKSGRANEMALENEERSTQKALMSFNDRYKQYATSKSSVNAHIEGNEIVLDFDFKGLPYSVVQAMLNELNAIHKDYQKGERNSKAIEHGKLEKHQMHLLRLYIMAIDILEKEEIITYREKEHDLLMSIRKGDYLESDGVTVTEDFTKLLAEYKGRFEKAAAGTKLPKVPNPETMDNIASYIYNECLLDIIGARLKDVTHR